MKRLAQLIGSILILASTGSLVDAAPVGFALVSQSQHFAFYSRGTARPNADKTEQYVQKLEALFGQELTGRIEYYRCERPEEIAALTGLYASGATSVAERWIFSVQDFHAHELVHLISGQLGRGGKFFDEGLAVAVAGEQPIKKADLKKALHAIGARPMSELMAGFDRMDPTMAYALAGSFVDFLIRTQGIGKLAEFLRACGTKGADPAPAFAAVFGTTLEDAGTSWKTSQA